MGSLARVSTNTVDACIEKSLVLVRLMRHPWCMRQSSLYYCTRFFRYASSFCELAAHSKIRLLLILPILQGVWIKHLAATYLHKRVSIFFEPLCSVPACTAPLRRLRVGYSSG